MAMHGGCPNDYILREFVCHNDFPSADYGRMVHVLDCVVLHARFYDRWLILPIGLIIC